MSIFDAVSAGTELYYEEHSGISVDDGVYTFRIGAGTNPLGNWDVNLWQAGMDAQGNLNRWLEIEVNGETLAPRTGLNSAPHAFTSTLALSSEKLGAKTAAESKAQKCNSKSEKKKIAEQKRENGSWLPVSGLHFFSQQQQNNRQT